ncbi:MAG: hypothetical protein IKG19_05390, partial [Lachnospiraceae bacterium]|nr:hypothetical protein [Lachnospiraceae bacterium]
SFRKAGQQFMGKDLLDESKIFVSREYSVIIDNDAAAFLPTVLKCIEPIIYCFSKMAAGR